MPSRRIEISRDRLTCPQFRYAFSRQNPGSACSFLGDEIVNVDLDRPETLGAALEGAHGVFLVTNFWEKGTHEREQATAAVRAPRDAVVAHLVLIDVAIARDATLVAMSRGARIRDAQLITGFAAPTTR